MRRSIPRRARLPSRAARHLASRGQLHATKPSTTHAITRRDVIYWAIRRRLTRVACLNTCRFLRQRPPTRRRQSRRRLHTSSSARPTAPCTTTHYHYCSPTSTSLNASTARRHVPRFHRRVSWRHSSEPRSPHSAPLSRLNLRCQLQSIRPASQRNCKYKTWRRSVILLWCL